MPRRARPDSACEVGLRSTLVALLLVSATLPGHINLDGWFSSPSLPFLRSTTTVCFIWPLPPPRHFAPSSGLSCNTPTLRYPSFPLDMCVIPARCRRRRVLTIHPRIGTSSTASPTTCRVPLLNRRSALRSSSLANCFYGSVVYPVALNVHVFKTSMTRRHIRYVMCPCFIHCASCPS